MITCQASRFPLSAHAQTSAEDVIVRQRKFWSAILFLTGTLGLISGLFGAGISAVTLFGESGAWGSLEVAGVLFVASAFLLLMLAAHAMDKISGLETWLKVEHSKRLGLLPSGDEFRLTNETDHEGSKRSNPR